MFARFLFRLISRMNQPDPSINRYDQWYQTGSARFYLENYTPNMEECRFLILKVIEQAVRDFVSFADSKEPELIEVCKEARSFLFDDDYYINWGDREFCLSEMLDLVDVDIEWFRTKTREKLLTREVT